MSSFTSRIHMKQLITLLLVFGAFALQAQNCQQVSMQLPIPSGVAKHHFPMQEMPTMMAGDHFGYSANWEQGDLTIKIRFSEDGEIWTKWEVLKRDFQNPSATFSPLQTANQAYTHFEWAVYNKAGEATDLSLSFYYEDEVFLYGNVAEVFQMEVTEGMCPQPEMTVPTSASSAIVSTNEKK